MTKRKPGNKQKNFTAVIYRTALNQHGHPSYEDRWVAVSMLLACNAA